MERCPFSKSGKHRGGVVVPGDDEHDLTFFCDRCLSIRRVPASGGLPLDDATASVLKSMMKGDSNAQR